jgi:hypothetical protein
MGMCTLYTPMHALRYVGDEMCMPVVTTAYDMVDLNHASLRFPSR